MTPRAWAPTMIALAVVVGAACTVSGPSPSTPPPLTATSPDASGGRTVPPPPHASNPSPSLAPPAALPIGTLVFGAAQRFPLDGDLQSDLVAFSDSVVWSAAPWQSTAPLRPGAGEIRQLALATAGIQTRYTATGTAAVTVKASSDWLVWLEAADTFAFSDARLFAAARAGGQVLLVDDLRQYPARILFPMWSIDGADLYWTVPQLRDGHPVGSLKHKRLPDGPVESIVDASPGELIALPSAYAGYLAYEVRSDHAESRVALRRPDGTTHDLATPASEPTVGDGFVAFKKAPTAAPGMLAAFLFSSERVVDLGVGEQPRAGGPWLTWGRQPAPGDPSPYMAVLVSRVEFACVARFVRPTPDANSAISLPSFGGNKAAWILSDYDLAQLQRHTLVVEELRDLRC